MEWLVSLQKNNVYPEKVICPRPIEEETYDFPGALLAGSMLITLINNADTVKISCRAQFANVIDPVMTRPDGGCWPQTIY